ncbi:Tripartite ATP-independent periplasmic transporters, DctQ component [Roseivivax jejudonensis]|uniref:TRAP transporter small permease protein n=1 Tax=Roseivivax jejudonensis TaxID=1529041 RepID=A0A1X7A567_9RHOB|nr:TRAP transporter small permease subunit [Roseivivax jejudonensis]SLN70887.1 Tripartite ATP-independent periplasmic transporters, DctQ component [Roseivivax jejudonensis]
MRRALISIAAPLGWVGAAALAVLGTTTVIGVVARYLFGAPIFGLEDVASVTLAVVVASGVAVAAHSQAHVAVDLLVGTLPDRAARAIALPVTLLGAGVCTFASWALIDKAACGRACGEFTSNLAISHLPFYWAFALAFAYYAATLLVECWHAVRPETES